MSKRVILPIVVILLAGLVNAANVTLEPSTIYEAVTSNLALNVNNYRGSGLVTLVAVNSTLLSSAENYSGWTTTLSSSRAEWSGVLGTNIRSALFEFSLKAPLLTQNTTVNLPVSTNGQSFILQLLILDDTTVPVLSSILPSGYVQASNQPISAVLSDPETGIANATYSINNCANGTTTTTALTSNQTHWIGTADFSSYTEGSQTCYTLTATNNAGETLTTSGQLIVDGTAPIVNLASPSGFISESTTFTFSASDNLAPNLTCGLYFNGTLLGTYTLANNTQTSATHTLNFSEGNKLWSVTCADGVGLTNTSVQSVVLDTQAPSVLLNNLTIRRDRATLFMSIVTDTIGLSTVNATLDGATVTLSQAGNNYSGTLLVTSIGAHDLTLNALDNAGHTTTKTVTVTAVPNHNVTLSLTPTSTSPGSAIIASGTLELDGSASQDEVIVKTPTGNFTATLSNGTYSVNFNAPDDGTYTVTVEFVEQGYAYTATQQFTVQSGSVQTTDNTYYSSGLGFRLRQSGGGATASTTDETQSEQPAEEQTEEQPAEKPAPAEYTPLEPEAPRQALRPKATGLFGLGDSINWLAPLLALALLAALGTYAYKRRPPKQP